MNAEFSRTRPACMGAVRWLLTLAFPALLSTAFAGPLDRDPFLPDVTYQNGQFATFGYGADLTREAGNGAPRIAALSNGGMVVANTVASPNSARRDGVGIAVFDADGDLIVDDVQFYPTPGPGISVFSVSDVEVLGNTVYVLVNHSTNVESPFLAAWSLSGQYLGRSLMVLGQPERLRPAVGLVAQPDPGNYLFVVGNAGFSDGDDFWSELVRWDIYAANVGEVGEFQGVAMSLPGCGPDDSCIATGLAQARLPGAAYGLNRYYLAVNTLVDGSLDRSPVLFRLYGLELQPDPSWAQLRVDFDDGQLRYARAGAMALDSTLATDTVYLTASVTTCRSVVGVAKIGHFGGTVTSTRLFGGDDPPVPCASSLREDFPGPAGFANGRLLIAGTTRPIPDNFYRQDGFLAVLDRELHLREFRPITFPLQGPRQRETLISGAIASSDGKLRVAGAASFSQNEADPALRGKAETIHGRFGPDRVFGSGFQLLPNP